MSVLGYLTFFLVIALYHIEAKEIVSNRRNLNPLGDISRRNVLRVGLTGDYPPYSLLQESRFTGLDVEMASDLAGHLGVNLSLVRTQWTTLESDLVANRFHMAMGGISIVERRQRSGYFSNPILVDGKRPISRCEDQDVYTSIESINRPGVRVIVNTGGTNMDFTRTNFPNASVRVFQDNRRIFDEIAENRADVFVTDGLEVEYQSQVFMNILCPTNVQSAFNRFQKAYLLQRSRSFRRIVNNWLRDALERVFKPSIERILRN